MRMKKQLLVALAGTCAGVGMAQAATQAPKLAHGNVVNVGGATLLQNFFTFRAAYNDYLDCDGNGVAGKFSNGVQDLADPANGTNAFWLLNYRATGSGAGLKELLNFGVAPDTGGVTGDNFGLCGYTSNPTPPPIWLAENNGLSSVAIDLYTNTERAINSSVPQFANTHFNYVLANPGGCPVRSDLTTFGYTTSVNPSDSGIRVDVGVLDVPSLWFVQKSGTPGPTAIPNSSGYGTNTKLATTKTGVATSQNNKLATLPAGFSIYSPTLGISTDTTVFDSPVTWAPIGVITNFGVGRTQATMTEIRHLFVTGRLPSGENLMAVTRDAGSGTRNGFSNALNADPSWTRGENIGVKTADNATNILGPDFQPSNKDGSGLMEQSVFNHRLAIGYTGAERAKSGGWIAVGDTPATRSGARADFLAIRNDIYPGGTTFQRPTLSNILHNNENGYLIGGPETFCTLGDPSAEPVANGGTNNGHDKMRSEAAALWVNNILRSIDNATSVPADPANFAMPGEEVVNLFTPYPALDNVKRLTDPTMLDPNPAFNASLQAYMLNPANGNTFHDAGYASTNTDGVGRSARKTGVTYTDGVLNGASYLKQDGSTQSYASVLPKRNKVSGDFNGDGLRNINDTCDMVSAWRQRNSGPAWSAPAGSGSISGAPGSDAIIEVLGDFDGDGNFNAADVRYFADGLAIDPDTGNLDRLLGFTQVDTCFGGNFFSTTKATGAAYIAGDSRADVAGAVGTTPGFAPVGADGVINAKDIDYVYAQFLTRGRSADAFNITDGEANWSNLDEAAFFDLSADINGDLVVNQADVCELLSILETTYGDVNLDGVADSTDDAIIMANLGTAGGWAQGDLNGDGQVTMDDLGFNGCSECAPCAADFDGNGGIDGADLAAFFTAYEAGTTCGDVDNNGGIDGADLAYFFAVYEAGGC